MNNVKETITKTALYLGIVILVIAIIYGCWHLKRWWNYNLGYEDQVETTIKSLVKPDCLKP